jgi:Protein of unknown function (DUF3238)
MISVPHLGWVTDCFLTDDRSFSSDVRASSRLHSEIEIDLSGTTPREIFQTHSSSGTVEIDCEDGDLEGTGFAQNKGKGFTDLRIISPGVNVKFEGAASDPLVKLAPQVNYKGTYIIDIPQRKVSFIGLVEPWPAFESYAAINGGAGQKIFQVPPEPGNTSWNLFADANRPVVGTTVFQ